MTLEPKQLEEALSGLAVLWQRTQGLRDELATSRSEFVERSGVLPGSEGQVLAQRRHLEWFLLERPSSVLGGVPIEVALHGGSDENPRELFGEQALAALVGSRCGVFEVTGVRTGEGVWLRDLLAFGEYPLQEVDGSLALQVGDLVVGRVFPVGAELYRLSTAAGTWRNPELLIALRSDLEQARSARRGVQRLSQVELESMFWGDDQRHRELALQRARSVLLAAGLPTADVEDIFEHLRGTPYQPERQLPGGGDAVGAVLDQLAFETDLDLGQARAALLEVWPVLSKGQSSAEQDLPEDSAPGESTSSQATVTPSVDVATAMASFDEGRTAGQDLGQLFDQLERELDLSSEGESEAEEPAPDFPGVVGAMVEEFLWETANEAGQAAADQHTRLRELSRFGASIGVFEEFGGRELLSFAAVWLPEWGALSTAQEAREMLASLQAFCSWTEERHEHLLGAAFEERIAPLAESLPRVIEANRARTAADPTAGDVFEYVSGEGRSAQIQISVGGPRSVRVPEALTAHLQPGDRVRGACDAEGELSVYCCYPAECAELTRPS